jgi:hypothetical protein
MSLVFEGEILCAVLRESSDIVLVMRAEEKEGRKKSC